MHNILDALETLKLELPKLDAQTVNELLDEYDQYVRPFVNAMVAVRMIPPEEVRKYAFPAPVEQAVRSKAQVQAVKDVLGAKGVPDQMDTGPLGNILSMSGIAPPPKKTGLGRRRKTRRSRV